MTASPSPTQTFRLRRTAASRSTRTNKSLARTDCTSPSGTPALSRPAASHEMFPDPVAPATLLPSSPPCGTARGSRLSPGSEYRATSACFQYPARAPHCCHLNFAEAGLSRVTSRNLLRVNGVTIVQNVNFLAGFGEFEALADLHLLLDRIVLEPLDPLLLLRVFPQNILIVLLVRRHLPPLGEQGRDPVRTLQLNECVGNAAKHHNRVYGFQRRVSHVSQVQETDPSSTMIVTLNRHA